MVRPNIAEPVGWLGVVALVLLVACGGRGSGSQLAALRGGVPDEVMGWRAPDRGQIYDAESIYSYIDGHAEVYLAYGMMGCLARRYAGPPGEADIVLDVFEMASPADAFGVFTYDRDGESVDIGRDGLLRYGWLSFWKGRFFVSVTAEVDSPAARAAVTALGAAVDSLIEGDAEPPTLVGELPPDGLDLRSVRFLRSQQILDTHLWLGEGDLFGLGPDTEAVLARYARGGHSAHLILVEYPDDGRAERAAAAVTERLGDPARSGVPAVDPAGRWHAAASRGTRLVAVVGAGSEELAAALLGEGAAAPGGD